MRKTPVAERLLHHELQCTRFGPKHLVNQPAGVVGAVQEGPRGVQEGSEGWTSLDPVRTRLRVGPGSPGARGPFPGPDPSRVV